jgi:hypothetical protein
VNPKLTVAVAVTKAKFLLGTHCVEFICNPERYELDNDAYWIRQIACCRLRQDPAERPILVERHRSFRSKTTDPWPAWRSLLGSGVGPHGFYGSCALHLESLLCPARLVSLAKSDRVPPEEPGWDPCRNRSKPDRLASERAAFEALR